MPTTLLSDIRAEFLSQKSTAEQAIAQLDDDQIRRSLDGDVNSIVIIMKHLAGNFRSRFTNFLTDDGEKSWRNRDSEFIDDFPPGRDGRAAAEAVWREGWAVLLAALDSLTDVDLTRTVSIRGEPMPASRALTRALAHAAYHTGQIILIARMLRGPQAWQTISIPRGGSEAHNKRMGYKPNG